jgi:hypothetical protein
MNEVQVSKGKEVKIEMLKNNIIPLHRRGIILGKTPEQPKRTTTLTNAAYAKQEGCTKRHASKILRGYNRPANV